MKKTYETERLILKVLDGKDAKLILDYYQRNKEFLKEWDGSYNDDFFMMETQQNKLDEEIEIINTGQMLRLWVFKKEQLDRTIGFVVFNNIIRGLFQSCFVGYKLDKEEINQGYVTEALRKGIEIMFDDYKLHRLEANIMPKNKSSLRVAEKIGFYNEGMSKKYLKINGKWEDHIHMVLLNEEV